MAVIYLILCRLENIQDFYLGTTTNMYNRTTSHINSKDKSYLYKFVKDNGGWDNFYFEVLENIDNEKMFETEGVYIELMKPSLNTYHNKRLNLNSQYYKRKDEPKYRAYQKQYYENNKEKYREATLRFRAKK
jgi:predicted GIY-YIG superfamily endonuclease